MKIAFLIIGLFCVHPCFGQSGRVGTLDWESILMASAEYAYLDSVRESISQKHLREGKEMFEILHRYLHEKFNNINTCGSPVQIEIQMRGIQEEARTVEQFLFRYNSKVEEYDSLMRMDIQNYVEKWTAERLAEFSLQKGYDWIWDEGSVLFSQKDVDVLDRDFAAYLLENGNNSHLLAEAHHIKVKYLLPDWGELFNAIPIPYLKTHSIGK